jgi:hypothetical protein
MEVRMPTSAMIPIAIIKEVSDVRNLLPLMEVKAIEIFSFKVVFTAIRYLNLQV